MVLVEFDVGPSLLREALAAAPETSVAVEQIAGYDLVQTVVRAAGDDVADFEANLTADPGVRAARRFPNEPPGGGRFCVRFGPETAATAVYRAMVELHAVLLSATGTAERWVVRMRFPGREDASAFRRRCEGAGLSVGVRKVARPDDPLPASVLTAAQREALAAALEAGYFEVPREATMADLADRLGVSEQAVSARLRRGHANLVRSALEADDRPTGRL